MDKQLNYMTQYRGFAILTILMVHCITRQFDKSDNLYPFIFAIFVNSTDFFLFISGFLFEYLLYKQYSYREFITKKVKRLIIPYCFWALPVSIFIFCMKDFDFYYLFYTIWTGLSHKNNPHWYIPFIFFVFVISPLFVYFAKKKLLYSVLLPIFLFISLTSERCLVHLWYGQTVTLNLIGFFFLGMFFSHYRDILIEKMYKLDWLFITLGFVVILIQSVFTVESAPPVLFEALKSYINCDIVLNFNALNKLFLSIGFVLLFKRLDNKSINSSFLNKIAHYSFGIYFCHLYIAALIDYLLLNILRINSHGGVIYVFCYFLSVLAFSALTIFLLRKCKYTKNIIGV